jgi:hypothetical protein
MDDEHGNSIDGNKGQVRTSADMLGSNEVRFPSCVNNYSYVS